MPGGGRCPDCGSSELVEDSHYSQNQLVCSDCGCVVTEGVLTTTFTDEGNLRGTSAGFSGAVGTAWGCGGIDVSLLISCRLPVTCTLKYERKQPKVDERAAEGQGLPFICVFLAPYLVYVVGINRC